MKRPIKVALLATNLPFTLFLIFVLACHYQNEEFLDANADHTPVEVPVSIAEKEVLEGLKQKKY